MSASHLDMDDALEDLELYRKCSAVGNVNVCVLIETRWKLDGFPPQIVTGVLRRVAEGESLDDAMEAVEG